MTQENQIINHIADKVIVVTGAASGFGKLVCEKASSLGAKIVAADINESGLNDFISSLKVNNSNNDSKATSLKVDVTDPNDMHKLAAHAIETFGSIDVMINNAGVMPLAYFADHEVATEAWDRCIDINFKGVLHGISAVHDQMMHQGRGHVINLSSIYGNFPVSGGGVYGATKAAVDFLSESLRQESQGKIKVTNVKPTGVPATSLGGGVINPGAVAGILGANAISYMGKFAEAAEGSLRNEETDVNNIQYWALEPEYLAEQIIYAINQPWGVSISEITVRAAGDAYVI
jgi:NADP-dependent 3-hydroxy acid dehydrogenase YdfG